MATPRTTAHTLSDMARLLAPNLRVISSSQPAPPLRTYNVIAITASQEDGRRAVLALESVEHNDEQLGTVVMASTAPESTRAEPRSADPEGVTRQLAPRVLVGGLLGAVAGALVIGVGAFALGARGWEVGGAAVGGAMLLSVFGIMWVSFAGMGGSDAYRQTFVEHGATSLTFVSIHTDDPDDAAAAHDRLRKTTLRVLDVDRFGHVAGSRYPATG